MRAFNIISLFPEILRPVFHQGVVGQALRQGLWELNLIDLREFGTGRHRQVDDKPFGGSDGMVMSFAPLESALLSVPYARRGRVVHLSPQGVRWNQARAEEWARDSWPVTLICSRYAGVDNRFVETYVDEEVSLGDFILTGGELAAACLLDSVVRLQPGVLGNAESPLRESFSRPRLEAPQFTRPRAIGGRNVPGVLLSGDHRQIARWKLAIETLRTAVLRPDLLSQEPPSQEERVSVEEFLRNASERDLVEAGLDPQRVSEVWRQTGAL